MREDNGAILPAPSPSSQVRHGALLKNNTSHGMASFIRTKIHNRYWQVKNGYATPRTQIQQVHAHFEGG
jgi:hypothetical protein